MQKARAKLMEAMTVTGAVPMEGKKGRVGRAARRGAARKTRGKKSARHARSAQVERLGVKSNYDDCSDD